MGAAGIIVVTVGRHVSGYDYRVGWKGMVYPRITLSASVSLCSIPNRKSAAQWSMTHTTRLEYWELRMEEGWMAE